MLWAFPGSFSAWRSGAALRVGGLDIGPVDISGGSVVIPVFVIAIGAVPYVARPVRAQVVSLREREFVLAARAAGMRPGPIMFRELLPNVAPTLIVLFPLIVGNAIQLEAALSFLGVGVQPPEPSWGTLVDEGRRADRDRADAGARSGSAHRVDGADAQPARRRRTPGIRSVRAAERVREADMIRFAVRRLASMVLVLLAVSVLVFLIFNAIPGGDPAARIAGEHASATQLEVVRSEWGFDRSLPVQYAHTMEKLFGAGLSRTSPRSTSARRSGRASPARSRWLSALPSCGSWAASALRFSSR